MYYLWDVRVLSIKPRLHTQLPEHNIIEATEKFPGGGGI